MAVKNVAAPAAGRVAAADETARATEVPTTIKARQFHEIASEWLSSKEKGLAPQRCTACSRTPSHVGFDPRSWSR